MKLVKGLTPRNAMVAAVNTYLTECGEGTRAELARSMGRTTEDVGSILSRMNRPYGLQPKRIYVIRYVYDDDVGRRYPRSVYALGDKPDAPKPRAKTDVEHSRRYRASKMRRVPSVFSLAESFRTIPLQGRL